MNKSEVQEIAVAAARATVDELFLRLGVDPGDPLEMQKDFAHLRASRRTVALIKARALVTTVSVAVAGALGALWLALRNNVPH